MQLAIVGLIELNRLIREGEGHYRISSRQVEGVEGTGYIQTV